MKKQEKLAIGISIVAIIVSVCGVYCSYTTSHEALSEAKKSNRLANNISIVTNRPYILFGDIQMSYGDKEIDDNSEKLKIYYNKLKFINNGNLPAWISSYSIYVSGKDRVIRVPFDSNSKTTESFTIAHGAEVDRTGGGELSQDVGDNHGDVVSFEEAVPKFVLIVVRYSGLGGLNRLGRWAYWELFIFEGKSTVERVKCGISNLSTKQIRELFFGQTQQLGSRSS